MQRRTFVKTSWQICPSEFLRYITTKRGLLITASPHKPDFIDKLIDRVARLMVFDLESKEVMDCSEGPGILR